MIGTELYFEFPLAGRRFKQVDLEDKKGANKTYTHTYAHNYIHSGFIYVSVCLTLT